MLTLNDHLHLTAGDIAPADGTVSHKLSDRVPAQWELARLDLFKLMGSARIQSLSLATRGGAAAFDPILLGRAEQDLPALKKSRRTLSR
jgi:hypothetical protein